ncbi:DUF4232 domain-containing protein [Streptomyces sp. NPDC050617]|uniref:DUF4232 domain-containing protein n=1 Tax=Streptomyces sp. NPDC050617 TaxID=3154628 RepID=UPI00343A8BF7
MHRISVRRAVVATAVALTATVALTACEAGDSSDSKAKDGSSSTAASSSESRGGSSADSSSGSGASSGNGSHSSSTSSTSSKEASTCRTANLRITAKNQGEAREGLGSIVIRFTNNGGDCRMNGFPGVDLKTNYGTQPVDRNKQEVGTPFTLKAGKTATANVVYPVNNSGGSGVRGTALVVTPPNETHHATVPVEVNLPVSDSGKGGLEVTPVFEEH